MSLKPADLRAHYYDLDLQDDPGDTDIYLALAEAADGPILELMAGTGRVAVPLALRGHQVVAVDRDAAMLRRAATYWKRVKNRATKGGSLELVEEDIGSIKLGRHFDLVIVALNSLLLLDGRAAQRSAFKVIARHLKPNGRAVVDVWLPSSDDLALYDGRLVLDWVRHDEETGQTVSKMTAARYHSAVRTARVTSLFEASHPGEAPTRITHEDTISFVSADELRAFAMDAGLIVDRIGGDYEMGQFANDSERVVMVIRARPR
jgi:SAM-dependent methyltransferase